MTETVVLPEQIAPRLAARVLALLDEVTLAVVPDRPDPRSVDHHSADYRGPRCIVCHQGGPLGGHHEPDGSVAWVHHSCHRRLHARHRGRGLRRFRRP
jgi:hypothetical protein